MKFPVLIVNLKNYRESSGSNADRFFEYARSLSSINNVMVAPPILDTLRYVGEYSDILIAQSVDVPGYGSYTGHVPLVRLVDEGLRYSLINHSEYKLPHETIKKILDEASQYDFEFVVCVDSIDEMKRLLEMDVYPAAYAIEPPELIGSGRSVSKYKPQVVSDAVDLGKEYGVPVLCGAGVSTGEDVTAASKLGAVGVLVASAIAKSPEPLKVMEDMARNL